MDEKAKLPLVETEANSIKIKLEEPEVLDSNLQHEAGLEFESRSEQNEVYIKTEVKEEDESEEMKYEPEVSFESDSNLQMIKEECVSDNDGTDEGLPTSESARLNTEVEYHDDDNCTCATPLERGHFLLGEVGLDCKPSGVYAAQGKNGNEELSSSPNFCSVHYKPPLEYNHDNKNVGSASEQRLHKCDYCEKSFKKRYDLNRHILIHSGVKPFKCDSCEKSFNKKASLIRHAVIHSGTKPYKCDTCGKTFNSNSNLKAHIVCHSGIKPYKCDICEKSYNNKSNLIRHASCHSGARPYNCSSCDKNFTRKSTLMRHALCHTDIKPYPCNQCEKGFKRKSHLIRHVLSHSL